MPNPEAQVEGPGDPVVGANLACRARSAGSFSASPSANPGGPRKRVGRAGTLPSAQLDAGVRSGGRRCSAAAQDVRPAAGARPARGARRPAPAAGGRGTASPTRRSSRPSPAPSPRSSRRRRPRAAPLDAPPEVQQAIWAANQIIGMPYVYGGGHTELQLPRLRLLGHRLVRAARRRPAARAARLRQLHAAGARPAGRVVHRLHEPRPRLRGHRRPAPRHQRRGRPRRPAGPRWRPVLRSTRGFRARHPLGF